MLNLELRTAPNAPLVEQVVTGVRQHIESRLLRPGARLPSIRTLAANHRISRFTVVEAYDRLVASGHVESRRGSGFYVTTPAVPETAVERSGGLERAVDLANLIAEVVSDDARVAFMGRKLYAGGCLPNDWQEESGIRRHARQVAASGIEVTDFGTALGYPPLRDYIARRIGDLGIGVPASQVLLTAGATQGFDLLIRYLLAPGDAVLVDDPGYYNLFGHLKLAGVRLLPVPRGPDGPDLAVLAQLAVAHQPKAYFTMSVLNNPTCTNIQPAIAHRLLQLAAQHRFNIVEDDIFSDFASNAPPRLAALDRLERTFYLGSYSKTLSSSLRVGFVAASADAIAALTRMKLLVTMTTSAFAERVVHEMLAGGHFRKQSRAFAIASTRGARALRRNSNAPAGCSTGCRIPGCSCGRAIRMSTTRSGLRRPPCAKACAWHPAHRFARITTRARGCASTRVASSIRRCSSCSRERVRSRRPSSGRAAKPVFSTPGGAATLSRISRFASSGPTQPARRTHLPGSRSL